MLQAGKSYLSHSPGSIGLAPDVNRMQLTGKSCTHSGLLDYAMAPIRPIG